MGEAPAILLIEDELRLRNNLQILLEGEGYKVTTACNGAEGIAKAKAEGRYRGRKPTARARAAEVKALKADGVRPIDIARRLGIGRASVYRVLGAEIRQG